LSYPTDKQSETDSETERDTDRQIERWTDRQVGRRRSSQTAMQSHSWTLSALETAVLRTDAMDRQTPSVTCRSSRLQTRCLRIRVTYSSQLESQQTDGQIARQRDRHGDRQTGKWTDPVPWANVCLSWRWLTCTVASINCQHWRTLRLRRCRCWERDATGRVGNGEGVFTLPSPAE